MKDELKIVNLRDKPEWIEPVQKLGDQHRKYLGFFPIEAFRKYAQDGLCLAAIFNQTLAGYLLYRTVRTKKRVSIIHLCVVKNCQGQGVGRALVESLSKSVSPYYLGISLRCRTDYEANGLWPNLGFILNGELSSRSQKKHILQEWWLDLGNERLFDLKHYTEDKIVAAIDANVFLDIERSGQQPTESHGLRADWIDEHVKFCVTGELRNELSRNSNEDEKRELLCRVDSYYSLIAQPPKLQPLVEKIKEILPSSNRKQANSDIRQLAHASGGYADCFLTRDEQLLKYADKLEEILNLRILRPSIFLSDLDSLLRKTVYAPKRLAGCTTLKIEQSTTEAQNYLDVFTAKNLGEKKSHLRNLIATLQTEPRLCTLKVIYNSTEEPIALLGIDSRLEDEILSVPLFRLASGKLEATLCHQLQMICIADALQKKKKGTLITDSYLSETAKVRLQAAGFFLDEGKYYKLHAPGLWEKNRLSEWLQTKGVKVFPRLANKLVKQFSNAEAKTTTLFLVERLLYPAKICSLDLPIYIVPIKPHWAQKLFDVHLAEGDLFADWIEKIASRENIYYRSANGTFSAPARLIWYISDDRNYCGSKAARAISYLDEVQKLPAKQAFKQHEHLGVYKWQEILTLAKNDPNSEIMTMRFSDTELLSQPISFEELNKILLSHGQSRNTFQAPVKISSHCFCSIYRKGVSC